MNVMRSMIGVMVGMLLFSACTPPPVVTRENCLPPQLPSCKPGVFNETLLDTNYPGAGEVYHQIKLLPEFVNTNGHDHALAMIKAGAKSYAMVTSSRSYAETADHGVTVQRLFLSEINPSVQFGKVAEILPSSGPEPFGSAFYHEKEGRLYYAGKSKDPDPNDYDLFVAKPVWHGTDLELTEIRSLVTLNERYYFDSHPSLSVDGLTIYFASDRRGGQGGVDLWYATRSSINSDSWSQPQPLGNTINTPCDEITPFINAAGRLIFASNGHRTVGGYDLFEAKPLGNGFDIVQNLGKPINTEADEYYPFAATDSTFYYASSQRAMFEGVNLYVLTSTMIPGRSIAQNQGNRHEDSIRNAQSEAERRRLYNEPATIHGRITQGKNRSPANGAELFVRNNETQEEILRDSLGPNGEFTLKLDKGKIYDVGAETSESFFALKTLDLRRSLDTNIVLDLHLPDTLILRINFPFDDYSNPYEFVIGDNGERLPMSWQNSLDLIAQSTKRSLGSLREVVVIGHTDSMGTDEYNERLGERRALFIRDELVKRGVPKSLLRIQSRGRRQPVAMRPGESDEIYRLRSRRAEFVKVFK